MGKHASNLPLTDNQTRDLDQLCDAFGSTVSPEDILSAYLQGGRKIETAAEILLSNLPGSSSGASSLSSKDDGQSEILEVSNEFLEKASIAETNTIALNQKKGSASMGTVIGVIGKDYAMPKSSRNELVEGAKPPKVNIEEFPVYENNETTPAVETLHKDTEEFLFKMLSDGYQLNMKVIQEVLGHCGYDVKMSMNKLLDISASTLEKSGDAFNLTAEEPLQIATDACKESAGRLVSGPKSSKRNKGGYLEKELLGELFTFPRRIEEAPKRIGLAKAYKKPRPFGKIVTEPFKDTPAELKTPVATLLGPEEGNEEDEGAYQVLRKSVEEYWITMKEYYKAAVEAFTVGDHNRAHKLMEEGHFYKKKAREADEKSAQFFFGSRGEGMSLDMHEQTPKETIRLLKHHLTNLSGIQDFPYLKIIVGGEIEGTKDADARKRQVKKFLEKQSIEWNEEKDGRVMVIKLDEIDPKGLSFAHKL